MSGSSGGYMPEIRRTENLDCTKLSFVTSLTSPVVAVIANLKVGDILDVELIAPSSLQIFDLNGILVGSLLTTFRDNLINCITNGYEFEAIVIRINGGNCDVKIKSR